MLFFVSEKIGRGHCLREAFLKRQVASENYYLCSLLQYSQVLEVVLWHLVNPTEVGLNPEIDKELSLMLKNSRQNVETGWF